MHAGSVAATLAADGKEGAIQFAASVTSLSWIPSESMTGPLRIPVDAGIAHYDDPPPDHIDDLERLRRDDRFRFANHHRAWIQVENGRISDFGYAGHGYMGATTLTLGAGHITIPAVSYPDLRADPVVMEDSVTFAQTTGGRTGAPLPHLINHLPYVQLRAPAVWTSLSLTLRVDGSHEFELTGASPMPRHWLYNNEGDLVAKSGIIDFQAWTRESSRENTPWGGADSPVIVAAAVTALERELSTRIMRQGAKPTIRKLAEGETLVRQGEATTDLFLLLDGLLAVEINDEPVGEAGPGSILGERAILEGGLRTATLRAITPAKVAVAAIDQIERGTLAELAGEHRREEEST